MSDKSYQKIEVVGTSSHSLEDAIQNAVTQAKKVSSNLRWFEVVETRGAINDNKVSQWQVTIKVGISLEG